MTGNRAWAAVTRVSRWLPGDRRAASVHDTMTIILWNFSTFGRIRRAQKAPINSEADTEGAGREPCCRAREPGRTLCPTRKLLLCPLRVPVFVTVGVPETRVVPNIPYRSSAPGRMLQQCGPSAKTWPCRLGGAGAAAAAGQLECPGRWLLLKLQTRTHPKLPVGVGAAWQTSARSLGVGLAVSGARVRHWWRWFAESEL